MGPTQTIQFNLPVDVVASMEAAIEAGQYHTPSEIATVALLEWQQRREAALRELQALWSEGVVSGPASPFTLDELLAKIREKRSSR